MDSFVLLLFLYVCKTSTVVHNISHWLLAFSRAIRRLCYPNNCRYETILFTYNQFSKTVWIYRMQFWGCAKSVPYKYDANKVTEYSDCTVVTVTFVETLAFQAMLMKYERFAAKHDTVQQLDSRTTV